MRANLVGAAIGGAVGAADFCMAYDVACERGTSGCYGAIRGDHSRRRRRRRDRAAASLEGRRGGDGAGLGVLRPRLDGRSLAAVGRESRARRRRRPFSGLRRKRSLRAGSCSAPTPCFSQGSPPRSAPERTRSGRRSACRRTSTACQTSPRRRLARCWARRGAEKSLPAPLSCACLNRRHTGTRRDVGSRPRAVGGWRTDQGRRSGRVLRHRPCSPIGEWRIS
jgi:hypothetical protein